MATVAEDVTKFQEVGLQLGQKQADKRKEPLEPSNLAKKVATAQSKAETAENNS